MFFRSSSSNTGGGPERRIYRRSPVDQPVALYDGREWCDCRIVDVSVGGAAFQSRFTPPVGKEVVVRIEGLGHFACRVLRQTEEGFAARFEAADFDLGPLDEDPVSTFNPPADPGEGARI